MYSEIEALANEIDGAFFVIGAAILAIELLNALFRGKLQKKGVLDMVASVSTQLPYLVVEVVLLTFAYAGYVYISDNLVMWSLPITTGTAIVALIASDFIYYWEHRLAHVTRVLWTQHAVHHSSRFMNITVAIRFGPFEGIASALFHLPLVFIGFPAELVFFSIIVVLAYQTWLHTELIGRLGPLEGILNTPSNHRVHHGCDDKYIDKNYGGILIIWDRLFGTYQAEEETPRYGLKRDYNSVNPLSVWFSELPKFCRDVVNSQSFGESVKRVFGRPDWEPKSDP
ncbi:MAG: sterol desaturase family protein [Pseudomonadota bacterium]